MNPLDEHLAACPACRPGTPCPGALAILQAGIQAPAPPPGDAALRRAEAWALEHCPKCPAPFPGVVPGSEPGFYRLRASRCPCATFELLLAGVILPPGKGDR